MKGLKPGRVPLERALSKLGLATRSQAREWILAGKVRANGRVQLDPGYGVIPERTPIEIDGARAAKAPRRLIALHKPRGVVSTRRDEKGRPTVFSLLREDEGHLIAVGRLDWATSGLLLMTNDTRLADWLTDPANGVPRTYLVEVRGEVTAESLARLRGGIRDDGELLEADEVELRKSSRRESHLTVRLHEGKNREIRRMFASLGHEVTRLKRVAFGGIELGKLPAGERREIDATEIEQLFPGAPEAGKNKGKAPR